MTISLSPQRLRSMGPGAWIREGWQHASRVPGGRHLFSRLLGVAIPYTGSIGAEVLTLEPGYAKVQLDERRAIRNHLSSIHAIALANLGELTGNLALACALPDDGRFIVTQLAIDYKKKARGRIIAECRCDPPTSAERREYQLHIALRDASGADVAEVVLTTLVGTIR
jgi:acyl-coenzyme A thioesterase PaaI-like protein